MLTYRKICCAKVSILKQGMAHFACKVVRPLSMHYWFYMGPGHTKLTNRQAWKKTIKINDQGSLVREQKRNNRGPCSNSNNNKNNKAFDFAYCASILMLDVDPPARRQMGHHEIGGLDREAWMPGVGMCLCEYVSVCVNLCGCTKW